MEELMYKNVKDWARKLLKEISVIVPRINKTRRNSSLTGRLEFGLRQDKSSGGAKRNSLLDTRIIYKQKKY